MAFGLPSKGISHPHGHLSLIEGIQNKLGSSYFTEHWREPMPHEQNLSG